MDAHGEVERAETGESVLDDEPQGLSALQSAREDKSVENLEEAQILAPHSDDVGRTISEKPTFMRIERKHISAETLTKYSIPHIDDPDPAFILITQWLPETQLEELWKETSAQEEDGSRSTSWPLTLLPPIRETSSSFESQPRTPKAYSEQNSPSQVQASRQKSIEIASGNSSPGPSKEVKSPTAIQSGEKVPATSTAADQWEDMEEKKERSRFSKGRRRSTWSRESVADRDPDRQVDRKLKNLAWAKRLNNEGIFKGFSQLQVLLIFQAQHDLVQDLEKFDSRKKGCRKKIRSQLHQYLKSLQDYQWTQTLKPVPGKDAENHLKELSAAFSNFESAYNNPYARDSGSLVDIGRRSTVDPIRKALSQFLPWQLSIDSPAQAELLTEMRNLGFAETEMPIQPMSTSWFVSSIARFLLALCGGLFLLVPMIIMNFVSRQNIKLLVASLFVVAFAAFMVSLKKTSSMEVFGGVAAYAAVLVIFVGNSGSIG